MNNERIPVLPANGDDSDRTIIYVVWLRRIDVIEHPEVINPQLPLCQ